MNINGYANILQSLSAVVTFGRYFSNKSCILTRVRRSQYLRVYPTLIVQPDGSTYTVRYHEPRKIIKLPLDLSTLSEEEKIVALERRKPMKKVEIVQEEIKDTFNRAAYIKMIKKR